MNTTQRVRQSTGLSQTQFSTTYEIPLATLKNWEQGRREPDETSLAYLKVIEKMPRLIAQALQGA